MCLITLSTLIATAILASRRRRESHAVSSHLAQSESPSEALPPSPSGAPPPYSAEEMHVSTISSETLAVPTVTRITNDELVSLTAEGHDPHTTRQDGAQVCAHVLTTHYLELSSEGGGVTLIAYLFHIILLIFGFYGVIFSKSSGEQPPRD